MRCPWQQKACCTPAATLRCSAVPALGKCLCCDCSVPIDCFQHLSSTLSSSKTSKDQGAAGGASTACPLPLRPVVSQVLVDLFVNYDCSLQAANLYERSIKAIRKLMALPEGAAAPFPPAAMQVQPLCHNGSMGPGLPLGVSKPSVLPGACCLLRSLPVTLGASFFLALFYAAESKGHGAQSAACGHQEPGHLGWAHQVCCRCSVTDPGCSCPQRHCGP